MNRRHALISLASAALVRSLAPAQAKTDTAFDQAAFDAAQASEKPILLHVFANWCETCHAQRAVLDKLEADAAFTNYVVLAIDFDTQKDVMRSFGATSRSTMIAFKGKTEVGRLVGDTKLATIKALMTKGL